MQSQKAILAILLIFCAGMVAGFFVGRSAAPSVLVSSSSSRLGKPSQVFQLSVDELDQRLDLSADQENKIREIYVESRKRLKFLLTPAVRDQVREEVRQLDESIRLELTEEQIAKYRQLPGMRTPAGGRPSTSEASEVEGASGPLPLPDSSEGNSTLPEANGTGS